MRGVVSSLLAAMSLLVVLGLRYPLQMLPLLLFELVLKSIWLIAFAINGRGHTGDGQSLFDGYCHFSTGNSVALRVCPLREEAWRSMEVTSPNDWGSTSQSPTGSSSFYGREWTRTDTFGR